MGENKNHGNQGGQVRKGNYEQRSSYEINDAGHGRHTDRTTSSQPTGTPPPPKK